MTTYDVHAHICPTELIDLLRVDGHRFDTEVLTGPDGEVSLVFAGRQKVGPLPPELGDRPARLAAMDAAGVDVQLVSHRTELSAYALAGDAGARYARAFNEILAAEVSRAPDRFVALGTVPLQNPTAAAEELRYAVRDLGMAGVEIASTVDGTALDAVELEPVWEVANELRCLVLLHPLPLRGVDLSRYFLANMVGRPAESTVAAAHLVFSGVLDRNPDLVLCMVHGGGFLPYQIGRMQKGYEVVPHLAARHLRTPPLEILRRIHFDSLVHIPQVITYLVDLVGADRVVMGSDYPYEMHERQPVKAIEAVPSLTADQRSQILGGNVERILAGIKR
ncbi:amidohydrolase family protein [Phytohabitans kaempferiae]|uniref:Amidohydrolase family protein n=1 Tax=Phytohabitans kaempferiae TaxID=1620943 RepID=A0ABV6M681_9ACTN